MKTLRLSLAAVALVLAAACSVSPTEPAAQDGTVVITNEADVEAAAETAAAPTIGSGT